MSAMTHLANANFLRGLAENLPHTHPQSHQPQQVELLQRLADEELAQARHDEWVRSKVAAARADTRPPLTAEAVSASLQARYERHRGAL